MSIKIIKAPAGMPVLGWSVVSPKGPAITGFDTAEQAHAWATEWHCKGSVVAPVTDHVSATQALVNYERHVQNLEEGEEWKRGKED